MIEELLEREREARCTSMAYVVMPDHIHWMLQLLPGQELSKVVASVKGRASIRINRLNRTRGRFWQPNFYDHAVRREEDLENLAHYLIMNPVRAGLVDRAERYRYWWSAWHPRDRA
jgi:REP element-mobilizing transposase RayT